MNMNQTFAAFEQFGKTGMEQAKALADVHQSAADTLVDRQMALLNTYMGLGMDQLALASRSKGINDFLTGQMELARGFGEKWMAEGRANLDAAVTIREHYRRWWEQGMTQANQAGAELKSRVAAAATA